MPFIGPIEVPAALNVGDFPFISDYPWGRVEGPEIVVHQMGPESANGKIEQRYILGGGAKQFSFRKDHLTPTEAAALREFWTACQGRYAEFNYLAPNEDGSFTPYVCRFKNPNLSFDYAFGCICSSGLELVEAPNVNIGYDVSAELYRFPSELLESGLAEQVQELIPLVKITPRDGSGDIFLSDRRCSIGTDQYEVRLLEIPAIEQTLNGASDEVSFKFGNADRVMTDLRNVVNLWRADIEFAFYHVGTQIKLNLWQGEIRSYHTRSADPVFEVQASDGFYELNLPYPRRKVSRTCEKVFDNAGSGCPFTAEGTLHTIRTLTQSDGTTTNYSFAPVSDSCDKGWDSPNGCLAHGMESRFGGVQAHPQTVVTKDNSTGLWGMHRSGLTSASLVSDSIYGTVLPEIYCNIDDPDTSVSFPVAAKIAVGRDEGDFYAALGIVGEGPIGEYAAPNSTTGICPHLLDGQPPHGWVNQDNRNLYGLRLGNITGDTGSLGLDPVPAGDHNNFSLGEGGGGIQRYGPERAAGTAWAEIRRKDEKGLQLSQLESHSMQIGIRKGLAGYTWTEPGVRSSTEALTSPVWVAVNAVLKAKGVFFADAATQEEYFDVAAAVASAAICAINAKKLIGTGTETQFSYQGIIGADGAAKPLRDQLTDILNTCLGYYTISSGRVKIGIRENSSAVQAFSDGNMIYGSLELTPRAPKFNHLTTGFLDSEYGYVQNTVVVYDEQHGKFLGGADNPQYEKTEISLPGVVTKSQAARIGTTRLREELGGYRPETYLYAHDGKLGTTLLGLTADPGMIIRVDHEDAPNYPATAAGSVDPSEARPNGMEARVQRWRLNPDLSIELAFTATHNEVYDLVLGPKPADVGAAPLMEEEEFPPKDWRVSAYTPHDGTLRLHRIAVGTNGDTVHQGHFDIYYVDEATARFGAALSDPTAPVETPQITATSATIRLSGQPLDGGDLVLIDEELIIVGAYTPVSINWGDITGLTRGAFGTRAADHARISGTIFAIDANDPCRLRVDTKLAIRPGQSLVLNDGTGPPFIQSEVSFYDPETGVLYTVLPITGADPGDPFYADPRAWRVKLHQETVNFQPRFMRLPSRARWEYQMPLPHAGVVLIRGYLNNTRGLKSETINLFPVSSDVMEPQTDPLYSSPWPHRLRTLGEQSFQLMIEKVASGDTPAAFVPLRAAAAQPVEEIFAEVTNAEANPPVYHPTATGTIVVTDLATQGTIILGGTLDAQSMVEVQVTGHNEIRVPVWLQRDSTATTLAEAATSLAAWLNSDSHFAEYFKASASSSTVEIIDKIGHGGTLAVDTSGTITATASGFGSQLNVLTGRKYALAYIGDGYRSALSPVSASTGPTGSGRRIEVREIPRSPDTRVTDTEIYAAADGADDPKYLVASIPQGTDYGIDTIAEIDLAKQPTYPGESQPTRDGGTTVTLTREGWPAIELYIPATASRSYIAHGFALDPITENTHLNADIHTDAGAVDIRVVLQ